MSAPVSRDVRGAATSIATDLRALSDSISRGAPITKALDTVLMLRAASALLDSAAKQLCRCDCTACRGHKP